MGPKATDTMSAERMDERAMQNRLYVEFDSRRHRLIVPNTTLLGSESEL